MASTTRSDLPLAEWKKLTFASGNQCAFPKCGKHLYTPGDDGQGDILIGRAAHIIAASRQGPRGDFDIPFDERDKSARNRVLLCPEHHVVVDSRPHVFTVQVLRKMKEDHERSHLPAPPDPVTQLLTDKLRPSLLPIIGLPAIVMSLPLKQRGLAERDLAKLIRWPADHDNTLSFIVREDCLHTFAYLDQPVHPFADVVDSGRPQISEARILCGDPEGHRRYTSLLNKALTRHLGLQGLRYDNQHRRYWFSAPADGSEVRVIRYRSKTDRLLTKEVVRRRIRRSTGEVKEWWHCAAGLRFDRVSPMGWVLTIRPEFQLTIDGRTPLAPKLQGSKTTRKKSRIYNEGYLDLVHFWVEFLAQGMPNLTIKTGEQRIVIATELITHDVTWPGVPGDIRAYHPREREHDLLTLIAELDAAEELAVTTSWSDEDEDEDDENGQ